MNGSSSEGFFSDAKIGGEYEISDAVDLLIQSGRTIDAIRMDGWRTDVGYPEDRDVAEQRLEGEGPAADAEAAEANTDASVE